MTFILKKPATFVVEEVPVTEPGQEKPGTMRVEYVYRTHSEYDAWVDSLKDKDYLAVVPEFVKGWANCRDADGNEIDFSPASLKQIAEASPPFPKDLFGAYRKGLFESRVKN